MAENNCNGNEKATHSLHNYWQLVHFLTKKQQHQNKTKKDCEISQEIESPVAFFQWVRKRNLAIKPLLNFSVAYTQYNERAFMPDHHVKSIEYAIS